MADLFRLLSRLQPEEDGEPPVRHRTGVIAAVNLDGTVDVTVGDALVPDVAILEAATVSESDVVQILVWGGDMLVLGKVRT